MAKILIQPYYHSKIYEFLDHPFVYPNPIVVEIAGVCAVVKIRLNTTNIKIEVRLYSMRKGNLAVAMRQRKIIIVKRERERVDVNTIL